MVNLKDKGGKIILQVTVRAFDSCEEINLSVCPALMLPYCALLNPFPHPICYLTPIPIISGLTNHLPYQQYTTVVEMYCVFIQGIITASQISYFFHILGRHFLGFCQNTGVKVLVERFDFFICLKDALEKIWWFVWEWYKWIKEKRFVNMHLSLLKKRKKKMRVNLMKVWILNLRNSHWLN